MNVSDLLKAKQAAKLGGQAEQQDPSETPAQAIATLEPASGHDSGPVKQVQEPVAKFDTNYFSNNAGNRDELTEAKKVDDQEEEKKEEPLPAA